MVGVKPSELADHFRKMESKARLLPGQFERTAQEEVLKGLPRGVSMRTTRGPEGVTVALSGHGARKAAASIKPRLQAVGKAAVAAVRQGDSV